VFTLTSSGSFSKIEEFLRGGKRKSIFSQLDAYGREGVRALASATPVDTSETANSWYYEIGQDSKGVYLEWHNDSMAGQTPVVILLQYGHGTGTGGYVQGKDFINPAIQPLMDKIADGVWKVVTS